MENSNKLVLFVGLCFISIGCGQQSSVGQMSVEENKSALLSQVIGVWIHSGTIWDGAKLNLRADSSFTYEDYSCLGGMHSEGRWTIRGNRVELVGASRPGSLSTKDSGQSLGRYDHGRDIANFELGQVEFEINNGTLSCITIGSRLSNLILSKSNNR